MHYEARVTPWSIFKINSLTGSVLQHGGKPSVIGNTRCSLICFFFNFKRMDVESRAAFMLTFETVKLLGTIETKSSEETESEKQLLRLLTPVSKLYTAKQVGGIDYSCPWGSPLGASVLAFEHWSYLIFIEYLFGGAVIMFSHFPFWFACCIRRVLLIRLFVELVR